MRTVSWTYLHRDFLLEGLSLAVIAGPSLAAKDAAEAEVCQSSMIAALSAAPGFKDEVQRTEIHHLSNDNPYFATNSQLFCRL